MPHLVQMNRKYSRKGMVLIGAEVQGSSKEAIEEMVEDHGLEFTITKGISGPSLSRGIPHMAVFNVEGELVYHGHPSNPDTEKAIRDALKEVEEEGGGADDPFARPTNLVEQREWTNADGRKMTATLLSLEGTTGKFRFPNGRQFDYDISNLSDDDQALIRDKAGDSAGEEPAEEDEEDEDRFEF